jgi:hypothetical protein
MHAWCSATNRSRPLASRSRLVHPCIACPRPPPPPPTARTLRKLGSATSAYQLRGLRVEPESPHPGTTCVSTLEATVLALSALEPGDEVVRAGARAILGAFDGMVAARARERADRAGGGKRGREEAAGGGTSTGTGGRGRGGGSGKKPKPKQKKKGR